MAVRGLNFAVALRKTLCRPSVRFVRTKKADVDFDALEENTEFEGIYASNETYESTPFGAIRRDKQNLPNRHGEFEVTQSGKPLLGFDVPIPEKELREVKEQRNKAEGVQPKAEKKPKKREERERPDIELKTVVKEIKLPSEFEDASGEGCETAYDAVRAELRKKDEPEVSEKLDSFGFRIIKAEIKPQIWTMPKDEVFKCLMRNIIFDSKELLILDKPYGLSMHGGGGLAVDDKMALTTHLDAMAKVFKVDKLYPVHRLDKDVTGALCIAKNQEIADTVKALFKARQVKKEYVAITRGVPPKKEGVIDAAIAEGSCEGKERMVIVPTAVPGSNVSVPKFKVTYPAVTRWKIISATKVTAFVRVLPVTGYRHQIRVHLGLGLRCPVLGDHKYSHLTMIGPQKLAGEMLDRLKVRQQKVRDIPIHLHSRHIVIPGILGNGRDLVVKSAVPHFFKKNLERLKIRF